MMIDGNFTISNEKREWDDVAHYCSAAVLSVSFGDMFAMGASTLDKLIPNTTFPPFRVI